MLQILVVVTMLGAGLAVLVKGKLQVTAKRVLPQGAGRILGATFMALSLLPVVLPVDIGLYAMLGAFFVACAVAFQVSQPAPGATAGGRGDSSRSGPSRGEQIVGAPCAKCSKKIMTEHEGRPCRVCGAPVHRACHRAHRDDAHAAAEAAAPAAERTAAS